MKRELFINATAAETRSALVEDGVLVELYVETPDEVQTVGNIYYGKVENVIKGMQAAFVDIGMNVNAFLPFNEVGQSSTLPTMLDEDEKEEETISISRPVNSPEDLVTGKGIFVQVIKEPWGEKGPRVTTAISIPGRFCVLVPWANYIGISKKIYSFNEKKRLKKMAQRVKPEGFGLIVRTVAEGKDDAVLEKDIRSLLQTWADVEKKVKSQLPPNLVYKDMESSSSVIRDLFTPDVDRVVIDSKAKYKSILNYVKNVAPNLADRVFLHSGGSLFEQHKISEQIEQSLSRKVWLKSGGHVVIEHTEALVSIDVNTGKFIGRRDQEQNSLRINLEAAREIARQLRLRDIGGLIVIDFIDLQYSENKKTLVDTFRRELKKDRAKVVVSQLSEFGLLEMTRQRIRMSLLYTVSDECPVCHGLGRIPSKESIITKMDSWIRRFRAHSKDMRLLITVHPTLLEYIIEKRKPLFRSLMWRHLLKIDFEANDSLALEEFRVFSRRQKKDITELY
ncbi:MAG TPA: Rne/Rng family ribonuclease [Candidatus Marinimicrobia bacterium]|nr:Rne/Rng family ribonuclease [Candidatus Neomarinimicrobiota bacterium]